MSLNSAEVSEIENRPVLTDSFGRQIDYLRLSVTDRCDLRCVYCMPPEGIQLYKSRQILSFDEIHRLVQILAGMGIKRVRLTGGEPLVRKNVQDLVRMLHGVEGINRVSMTTNATQLAGNVKALKDAGLRDLNVSIDSLDPIRYERITRGGSLRQVLQGLDAALAMGINVKVNAVALYGLSLNEALSFAAFSRSRNVPVRFIEFMPLCGSGWTKEAFRPLTHFRDELKKLLGLRFVGIHGVAECYAFPGGGELGFIASLSNTFCLQCSRIRITATGQIRPCLFSKFGVDLRTPMRENRDDDALRNEIRYAVASKGPGHGIDSVHPTRPVDAPHIRTVGG